MDHDVIPKEAWASLDEFLIVLRESGEPHDRDRLLSGGVRVTLPRRGMQFVYGKRGRFVYFER
jgi:hypothetical protein